MKLTPMTGRIALSILLTGLSAGTTAVLFKLLTPDFEGMGMHNMSTGLDFWMQLGEVALPIAGLTMVGLHAILIGQQLKELPLVQVATAVPRVTKTFFKMTAWVAGLSTTISGNYVPPVPLRAHQGSTVRPLPATVMAKAVMPALPGRRTLRKVA